MKQYCVFLLGVSLGDVYWICIWWYPHWNIAIDNDIDPQSQLLAFLTGSGQFSAENPTCSSEKGGFWPAQYFPLSHWQHCPAISPSPENSGCRHQWRKQAEQLSHPHARFESVFISALHARKFVVLRLWILNKGSQLEFFISVSCQIYGQT